ncbi:MAG: multimeric flavodoxin WrbA [Clostridiaceae bacterium]|jgi:multimeric flavodoxin WrbA|nr:multimeric flavodoxin WrbA [Clostridiaceae bacterium]
MPKILAFNGSPHIDGNTSIAIKIVTNELNNNGIETETIQIGGQNIKPCLGCRKCFELKNKSCIIKNDIVNELILKMEKSDGFIIGSPVYTSNVTSEVKAFIDRTCYVGKANNFMFKEKVGAPVVVASKTGTNYAYAAINFMFGISEMITVGSTYWNCAYGKMPGEVLNDKESIKSLAKLGENMAVLLQKIKYFGGTNG